MKPIHYLLLFFISSQLILVSCKSEGEFTGREYMPDMAHSIAYEANQYTYYSLNHWGGMEEYLKFVQPRIPVSGTVAFGRSKEAVRANSIYTYPVYAFENSDTGRTEAIKLITDNPFKVSSSEDLEKVLTQGKELYDIYCSSCHGKEGDGNGQLYASGVYPAAPANYLKDEFIDASNGRYYHAIMYGKGVMLSHADKLSHDERWMVIHYIRSLQAPKRGAEYNVEVANLGKIPAAAAKTEEK